MKRAAAARQGKLLADAGNAIDSEYPHPLTRCEGHIRIHFLYIGTGLTAILADGDLDTLVAGDALFGSRTGHAASHRAQHTSNDAATPTADGATGHAADHGACAGANVSLGAFNLYQPHGLYRAHAHGLRRARFIAAVGVPGQPGSTPAQDQRDTQQAALDNSCVHDSPRICAATRGLPIGLRPAPSEDWTRAGQECCAGPFIGFSSARVEVHRGLS